jgi:membrane associated rhomboid family serine protease
MIVPLTTDAPIYHRPYGTVGLILLNLFAFLATAHDPAVLIRWGLMHGFGPTPLQWLTSNFIHGSWLHLLGNMVFLWGFGLVVEGKIGWKAFLPVYVGIGVSQCALEQMLFASVPGTVSFGASSIVFGLMAIALIWAPRNDLTLGYWLIVWAGTVDIPIVWFAALTLLKSLLVAWLMPGATSELLHLMGAGIGVGIGFAMLWSRLVDCEGWDLVSVMTGRTPRSETAFSYGHQSDRDRRRSVRRPPAPKPAARRDRSNQVRPHPPEPVGTRFSELLNEGKATAAVAELHRIRHLRPDWHPPDEDLLQLARGLRTAKQWNAAVETYQEYIARRSDASLARLELAELYVLVQERPAAAQRVLADCDPSGFTLPQKRRFEQVTEHAERMITDGVIEIEGESWSDL